MGAGGADCRAGVAADAAAGEGGAVMNAEEWPEERYARLMVECGCCIEEVAIVFGWSIADTVHTIAPALKANPVEAKRVRRLLSQQLTTRQETPAIHRANRQQNRAGLLYGSGDVGVKRQAA